MGRHLKAEHYTLGWICALSVELTAARAILDEIHHPLPQDELDDNTYLFGSIGSHNIIIACLPDGVYGLTSAAAVACNLRRSFPSITAALMVGIAGGAPEPPQRDIRLGDVVVGKPVPECSGVLQYDFGKTLQAGRFVQTGVVNKPPKLFLTGLAKLKSEYQLQQRNDVQEIVTYLLDNNVIPKEFSRPPGKSDQLFKAEYDHDAEYESCSQCAADMVVERTPRQYDQPYIHYGLIASGNQVMKNGVTRDLLAKKNNVLCFEMEAAGIVDELPSLIIRGICDYADSHKNKEWQPYASLCAAAFARALVLRLPEKAHHKGKRAPRLPFNLPIAEGAIFGSYSDQTEPECLDGTRVDLLQEISQWSKNPQEKSIFWLVGMAGTGKSTIARTVAKRLVENSQLAASFFFKRGEADRSGSRRLFTTIAKQLANHYDGIAPRIYKAIQADPDIYEKALSEQFERLIFEPLSTIEPDSAAQLLSTASSYFAADPPTLGILPAIKPVPRTIRTRPILVVLIDALDECDGSNDIKIIIKLLARFKDLELVDLRVFLTSRPDLPIRLGFKKLSTGMYKDIKLHKVPKIEHDISLFLQHELSEIRIEHEIPDMKEYGLLQQWPGDERLQKLVEMAVPLFIYAATLCRFIGDDYENPEGRLEEILNYQSNRQLSQLQKTYLPVLDKLLARATETDQKRLIDDFQQIVGTIINLASPLSISGLAGLLCIRHDIVITRLRPLHSVLDVPEDSNANAPIRTLHLSFRDFLVDESLREKSPFWMDERKSHRMIVEKCIQRMSGPGGLKRNICNLDQPGKLRAEIDDIVINKHIPTELQYACRFWVYHLKQGGRVITDNDPIHKFLQKHLLHWLEAASLINTMSDVLKAMTDLMSLVSTENGEALSELVQDAIRFMIRNQYIISKAPLQTYYSAVVFVPKRSIIRSQFEAEGQIEWASQLPQVEDEWDALLQTLYGHTSLVNSVAFSPDGKTVASASWHHTVRLWDAATGQALACLRGHTRNVNSVAFSPDSKTVASASWDHTVRLWDVATGQALTCLRGHTDGVNSVAFSPDDKTVASASSDHTVRLWDAATGQALTCLRGHIGDVNSVAFSPDGKIVASASSDHTVRLWDAATGQALTCLRSHIRNVNSVAFSPDGKTVASASWDHTVRLWDAATGQALTCLRGHIGDVNSVAFSPDGKTVASASSDHTVRLWDAATGQALTCLRGHTGGVNSVAFSPDDKTVASASWDHTVRLWDAATGQALTCLRGHTSNVRSVAFSPDDKTVASASSDHTVRLWDAATGQALTCLRGHTDDVNSVVFSPNGKTVASASWDHTVRLWDAATGQALACLRGHIDGVRSIAFSPDGKTVASASSDHTVRLWDAATEQALTCLRGHTGDVNSVAFSPDGKTVASASWDHTVRLWDAATGQTISVNHIGNSSSNLRFSKDGRYLLTNRQSFSITQDMDSTLCSLHSTRDLHLGLHQDLLQEILIDDEWLIKGHERLLWLPFNYRPSCSAVAGSTICIGHSSGGVSFLTFAM